MDYNIIYDKLIDRALTRTITGFTEKHHIIPKCVGGEDSNFNMVKLTPEEHYLAHQLLVKMSLYKQHPNFNKLIFAMNMMTVGISRNNKSYGWCKRMLTEVMSEHFTGKKQSEETIKKRTSKTTGKKRTEEFKQAMSKRKTGVKRAPFSKEHLERMRLSVTGENNGMFGRKHTDEARQQISNANKGRIVTPEKRAAMSVACMGKKDSDVTRQRKSIAVKEIWRKRKENREKINEL
jgi:hypothetical protein